MFLRDLKPLVKTVEPAYPPRGHAQACLLTSESHELQPAKRAGAALRLPGSQKLSRAWAVLRWSHLYLLSNHLPPRASPLLSFIPQISQAPPLQAGGSRFVLFFPGGLVNNNTFLCCVPRKSLFGLLCIRKTKNFPQDPLLPEPWSLSGERGAQALGRGRPKVPAPGGPQPSTQSLGGGGGGGDQHGAPSENPCSPAQSSPEGKGSSPWNPEASLQTSLMSLVFNGPSLINSFRPLVHSQQ